MEKRQGSLGILLPILLITLLYSAIHPLSLFAQERSLSPISTANKESVFSVVKEKTALASAALVSHAENSQKQDPRVKILEEFLKQYDSPLAPFAATFVREADTYKLDWRLVAAISGLESTFGHYTPYNSFNAWGWGVFGENVIYFASYDEGIATISRELRQRYVNEWGAESVHEIGSYYATSPTWAVRVVYFMEKIKEFEAQNPQLALSIPL